MLFIIRVLEASFRKRCENFESPIEANLHRLSVFLFLKVTSPPGPPHSGKKAKFLCRHQKNIFFAILD